VHLLRVARRAQRIMIGGSTARPLDRPALVHAAGELADRVDLGFDLPRLVEAGYEPVPHVDARVLEDQRSAAAGGRSFLPQRADGIHCQRAARRQVAGEAGNCTEHEHDADDRQRIRRRDAVEHAA
ncbi:MAG: hypothetical protein ACREK1_06545, partial [Longimicrobiales bacterium]